MSLLSIFTVGRFVSQGLELPSRVDGQGAELLRGFSHREDKMPMGGLLRLASLSAVCVMVFSTPLFADGVYRFTDRPDSFLEKPVYFTDTDPLLSGGPAFGDFTPYGSSPPHWNWLRDFDDDHGKERAWHNHFHYGYGGGWTFRDQDWDNDGNSGKKGNAGPGPSGIGGNSTAAVPEPTVLVLLSAALAAFLLKSLSKAMV